MSGSLWEKYTELHRARDVVRKLHREIRDMEAERAMSKLIRLPPHQRAVLLSLLVDTADWHEECTYFSGYGSMCSASALNRRQVRRALLALRRLGFVQYGKGLCDDDGQFRGSGWRITKAGCEWWWAKEVSQATAAALQ